MDSCVGELILAARKPAVAAVAIVARTTTTRMAVAAVARATVMIFDYTCAGWTSSISKERPSNHQAHIAPGIARFRNFDSRNSLAFSRESQLPVSCPRSVYAALPWWLTISNNYRCIAPPPRRLGRPGSSYKTHDHLYVTNTVVLSNYDYRQQKILHLTNIPFGVKYVTLTRLFHWSKYNVLENWVTITGLAHCHGEPSLRIDSTNKQKKTCWHWFGRSWLTMTFCLYTCSIRTIVFQKMTGNCYVLETRWPRVEQPYGTAAETTLNLAPPNAPTPSFESLCDVELPPLFMPPPLPLSPPLPSVPPTDVSPPLSLLPPFFTMYTVQLYHARIPLIYT